MKTVKELFEMEARFKEECDKQEGVRLCESCGTLMTSGCVWGDGSHVECEPCKDKSTTPEDWEAAVNNDEAYWTEWEEEYESD